MDKRKVIEASRSAFTDLVKESSLMQGRTWCLFNPYEGANMSLFIVVSDKATGFGTSIPIKKENVIYLDKNLMKQIMNKVMAGILKAVKKYEGQGREMDYRNYPIKARGKVSKFDGSVDISNSTVEFYRWGLEINE